MFEFITLPNHVLPTLGPFCHAVRAGDFLFVTGQLAEDAEKGEVVVGSIEEQANKVMENLKSVLTHAGTGFDRIVMARIFLTDIRHIDIVNEIYASYFPSQRFPGRTTISVTGLAGSGDIEIDLIVYLGAA
jgi:2-iminobutanoate/2-iminopropanoate deaminase